MITLVDHPDGLVLAVRAQPGARVNAIRGEHQGALKVAVTQIAEKGKANRAVQEVLCRTLAVNRSQVQLLSGETSQDKRFLISGVGRAELESRIATAMAAG